MPWDGSGQFVRIFGATGWVNDAATAVNILASRHDTHDQDIAVGIQNAITKDGQSKPAAHLIPNVSNTYDLGAVGTIWRALYAGTITATTIIGSVIGTSISYLRTAAEILAGITPTDTTVVFANVLRYGILNDGTTDVTAACNTLGAAVWPSETVLVFPPGQYKITNTVTFTGANIHIAMQPGAQFVYTGTADRAVVVRDYGATPASARTERYNVTTSVSHPYTNFAFIGVQFKGSFGSSHIYLDYAIGFTIGWQVAGNNANGVAYNDFIIGTCFDCAYQLNIHSSIANGFVSDNNWYGGQFQISGAFNAANPTVAVYGVVFDAAGGAYTGHNNNHFWKPCFQLSAAGTTQREPIWMKNAGGFNQFHGIRAEGLYGAVMHIDADTVSVNNNKLEIGYIGAGGGGLITAYISETDGGFSYGNWCVSVPGGTAVTHYESGDLVQKAWAPASANYGVLGHFVQSSASGTEGVSGPGEIGKDYLVINSGSGSFGFYVDTSFYKEFEIKPNCLATRPGRLAIVAYDSTGTQIASTRAVYFGGATQAATYGTASYSTSADLSGPTLFRVDSTVKSIKIIFASGTNPCCLRSYVLTAYANGAFLGGTSPYALATYGGPFAPVQKINTTAPNGILGEGYTPRGDIRWNGNAVAGNTVPAGHICTAAGWNARAWVATTAYQLNMLRTNDTAPVKTYVCRQAGTSAGSGGPTGTGTGIVDGGCLWDYVGVPVTTAATWTALANVP